MAVAFITIAKDNQKCMIIIAINISGIGINNFDIKLVIQWNISKFGDLII